MHHWDSPSRTPLLPLWARAMAASSILLPDPQNPSRG